MKSHFEKDDLKALARTTAEILVVWIVAWIVLSLLDEARRRFNPREYWAWLKTPSGQFASYLAGEDDVSLGDTPEGRSGGPGGDS